MQNLSPSSDNNKKKKIIFGITLTAVAVTAIAIPVATYIADESTKCVLTISDNLSSTKDYALKIQKGTKISDLKVDIKDGHTFLGWFKDHACTEEYSQDDVISTKTTIYAKYEVHRFDVSVTLPQDTTLTMLKENGDAYTPEELTDVAYGTKIKFTISSIDQVEGTSYFYVINKNDVPMQTNSDGLYTFTVKEDADISIHGRFEYETTKTDVYGNSLKKAIAVITNYIDYSDSDTVDIPELIDELKVQEIHNISGGDLSDENTSIKTLNISKNVRYVNAQYLKLCKHLRTINVSETNTAMHVENDVLYLQEGNNLSAVFYPVENLSTNVVLQANTTHIDSYAFAYSTITSTNIASLTKLAYIGDCAFLSSNLTSVTLPDSVKFLGYSAFNSCQSLAEVNILCDKLDLGYSLANGASAWSEVQGLSYAFANCPALAKIYWDANTNLRPITYPDYLNAPISYASGLFFNSGIEGGVEFKIGQHVTSFDHENILANTNTNYITLGSTLKVASLIFETGSHNALASFEENIAWKTHLANYEQTLQDNLTHVYFEKDFFTTAGLNLGMTFTINAGGPYSQVSYAYDSTIVNDNYYVFTQTTVSE